MEIHLLDMGTVRYGDSILITQDNKTILIDGGHPSDSNSIRMQLKKLLKQDPPFEIDLLIVTHCHSDHIGCLPDLIKIQDIIPKKALLADEKLGFGSFIAKSDALTDSGRTLFAALDEEDHSDLDDEEMDQFLYDAATLQSKYHDMVEQLQADLGDDLIIFTGVEDGYDNLEQEFKNFGLKILGPTKAHLEVCAKYLAKAQKVAGKNDALLSDNLEESDIAKLYKQLTVELKSDALGFQDKAGPGAAKNDQSIILSVNADGLKALLTGDMQFGVSEVPGLDEHMAVLLKTVNSEGPYDFIKFAHHTSYNGLGHDGAVLDEWLKTTSLYAHSGGLNDKSHPDPEMLKFLKSRKDEFYFARTDRNGLITVQNKKTPEMLISKGDFNNFAVNKKASDELNIPVASAPKSLVSAPVFETAAPTEKGFIEITAKIPNDDSRVTLTIDIDKKKVQSVM